jgi:hypothetical protein
MSKNPKVKNLLVFQNKIKIILFPKLCHYLDFKFYKKKKSALIQRFLKKNKLTSNIVHNYLLKSNLINHCL